MDTVAGLLPLVAIVGIFWLVLVRPQRRRQVELARTQRGVSVGDEVMLGSGIFGRVASVEPDDSETLMVEISPGSTVKVARAAIARIVTEVPEDEAHDGSDEHDPSDHDDHEPDELDGKNE